MVQLKMLSFVEGLGYVGAAMIGLAGLTNVPALRNFLIAGVVFCAIALVRLLVINATLLSEHKERESAGAQGAAKSKQSKEEETQ